MRYRPIRRNNEFGRVYARGKSYVNQALVLYVLKTRGKRTRVGLTATKKIGHAVQRNRARRVMKAAIDEHRRLRSGIRGPGHDPAAQELAAQQHRGKAVCPGRPAGQGKAAGRTAARHPASGP